MTNAGRVCSTRFCELDEYYLTRTEQAIIERYVQQMADQLGGQVQLVEFGSGSSTKTRILLDHLDDPVAYVPVDISEDHLYKTAARLQTAYPRIEILPVAADFTQEFELPRSRRAPASHAAIFFPGSTIGNFTRPAAVKTLTGMSRMLGVQGGLLIGIDLQKDRTMIEAAYNDSEGVTDKFNLNLLHRLNRELDADFEIGQFRHQAVYNEAEGRVEIFVVSCREQIVSIGDRRFRFDRGERILTEYSHKYTVPGFRGWRSRPAFRYIVIGLTRIGSSPCSTSFAIYSRKMEAGPLSGRETRGFAAIHAGMRIKTRTGRNLAMPRAIWKGKTLAESDRTVVVEGNHYFPPTAIQRPYFRECSATTICGWKGTAKYYDIVVDDQVNEQAAWYYPDPKPEAANIKDHIAFWKGVEIVS